MRPLDLGAETDFALGALTVHPATRQVSADARQKTVEPRVMQVLVALARAEGAVVSRDQLVERCWGGRVVGDDAVNSCLAKVRALADFTPERSFEIETIPRVGYRLHQLEPAQPAGADSSFVPEIAPPAAASKMRRGASAYLWGLAAAIAAGAAALAAYLYWQQPGQWMIVESHMPFIATPMIERYPAISPDGTMVAYSAGPTIDDRHIFLRLIKGGDPIQLTHDAYDASAPAWSPDGRTVAYVIFRSGHPCRIMEMIVPAGQPRQVGQCRVAERSSLAFDGGGRALFFSDGGAQGAPRALAKLDLGTGRVSQVTHPQGAAESNDGPTLSPDGKSLLYVRALANNRNEARILSLADGADRLFAALNDEDDAVAWAADGTTVFIARNRAGNDGSLWAYPALGGTPRQILGAGGYIGRLSAGPGGLLATEMNYGFGLLVAAMPHSNLPAEPLDETGGLNTWCVDYAPDGTMLATGRRSDTFGIWISDAEGTLRQLISFRTGNACAIRWSPDGTRFAYIYSAGNGFDVPVMTLGRQAGCALPLL